MKGNLIVYSLKVENEQLEYAKKFFNRKGSLLQDSLRGFIDVAADCERCLELQEEDASIGELQSAFVTLLNNCKRTWHLNNLLQVSIVKMAEISKVPLVFITNVLAEAQRIKPAVRGI